MHCSISIRSLLETMEAAVMAGRMEDIAFGDDGIGSGGGAGGGSGDGSD